MTTPIWLAVLGMGSLFLGAIAISLCAIGAIWKNTMTIQIGASVLVVCVVVFVFAIFFTHAYDKL